MVRRFQQYLAKDLSKSKCFMTIFSASKNAIDLEQAEICSSIRLEMTAS